MTLMNEFWIVDTTFHYIFMAILDTDLKKSMLHFAGEGKDSTDDIVKSQSTLQAPFTVVK